MGVSREHHSKNTVEATYWCRKCGKPTLHRVDDGLRGPCLTCMQKPLPEKKPPQPAATQKSLFDQEEK
jgi:hypothetical protein